MVAQKGENSMKLENLLNKYKNNLSYIETALDREWGYSTERLEGMLEQIGKDLFYDMLDVEDWEKYRIRKATKKEIKKHTIKSQHIVTGFEAAMNKVGYGIEVEEGKEIEVAEKPWGMLDFDGKSYPVYADDPGQCDYIILDNERLSGGSYNFNPEETFISMILENMRYKIAERIKDK